MKSEQRHHLQTNALADRLGHGIDAVQPVSQWIIGGIVLILGGFLVWGVYSTYAGSRASEAWTEYYFTLNTHDADSFTAVADAFPGSVAALWALQTSGDENLADGIEALYRDKAEAEKLLQAAISTYQQVEQRAFQPELRTRATLGLAQANESLGKLDEAKRLYQQVASASELPELSGLANQRLSYISSEAGKNFYSWFDSLKPAPATPPAMSGDVGTVPSSPDLQFSPTTLPGGQEVPKDTPPATPLKLDLPNIPAPESTPSRAAEATPAEQSAPAAGSPATPTQPAAEAAATEASAPADGTAAEPTPAAKSE